MRPGTNLRRSLYASLGILLATGLAWLFVVHVLPGEQPTALAPLLMKLHGAAAMVALALGGAAAATHVPAAWREPRNRASGAVLGTTLLFIAATGWLLYYAGSDSLRAAASAAHWIVGLLVPVVFAVHAWLGAVGRLRRQSRKDESFAALQRSNQR